MATNDAPGAEVPHVGGVAELRELTAARGFAASAVVLYHVDAYSGGALSTVLPTLALGRLAVDFFFVLSGFVLAHVYGDAIAAGRYRHADFLVRRFARIWPLHAACLLIVAAIVGAGALIGLQPPWRPTLSSFVAHLTMLHSTGLSESKAWNQPSWSVSAEWCAYLAFPLYVAVASSLKSCAAKLGAALALFASLWLMFGLLTGGDLLASTNDAGALRIVPSFFAGVALRQCFGLGLGAQASDRRLDWSLWGVLVLGALGLFADAPTALVWPALGALVFLLARRSERPRTTLLRARPLVWLGEASYALYLIHAPVLMVAFGLAGKLLHVSGAAGLLATGAVAALAAVASAGILHHVLERPAQKAILALWGSRGRRAAPQSA